MSWLHWTSAPGLLQYLHRACFRMWGLSVGDPRFPVDAALEPRGSSPLFCMRLWGRAEPLSLLRFTPQLVGTDGRYWTSDWPLQGTWASLQKVRTLDRGGLPTEHGRDVSSQSLGPLGPLGHYVARGWGLQPHRSLKAAILPRLAARVAIASLAWPPWRWCCAGSYHGRSHPWQRSCGENLTGTSGLGLEGFPGSAWASTPKPESVCLTILCLSPTLLTLTGGYPRATFSGKNQLRALVNKSPGHDRSVSIKTPLMAF